MEERIAAAFHDSYERLAPAFGYDTREASKLPWPQLNLQMRGLMCEVIRDLIGKGFIEPGPAATPPFQEDDRMPGEPVDAYSLRKAQEAREAREAERPKVSQQDATADVLSKFTSLWRR